MKKQTLAKILAAGLGIVTMFGGCGNGTSDPVCECPAGKTHEAGAPCCDGEDCACGVTPATPAPQPAPNCTCANKIHGDAPCDCGDANCECEQKTYALKYNVKVINETGEKLREELIADITKALDYFASPEYTEPYAQMDVVSARYPEVFITNNAEEAEAIDGDTIKLGKQQMLTQSLVQGMLETMFYDMADKPDPKSVSMKKSRSDIRLATGKNMNIGRRANTAYVAYQRWFSKNAQRMAKDSRVYGG
ncbi:MAG: hypothetical protein LBP76_03625 [Treponema sp.]|jgi:hypothetical protein|nr:hypothetical protein [Treponema sp.]